MNSGANLKMCTIVFIVKMVIQAVVVAMVAELSLAIILIRVQ